MIPLLAVFIYSMITLLFLCHADVPGPPKNPSVRVDDTVESLTIVVTITWQPPENLRQFDLDKYTVNISGMDISMQVPAGTTVLQLTDERMQRYRGTFNVTITATNMCGLSGGAASTNINVPSKPCCNAI